MMFLLDLAFSVELIALGMGVCILIWALRNEGAGVKLAKVVGYVVSIGALLALLCTTYYGTCYWMKGYFDSPRSSLMLNKQQMQQHQELMQKHRNMIQEKLHKLDN